ncbi:hypothetical protein VT84_20305 [Gemmata sp. SH-PL17]|uniref:hypothetical protein n=1 Tax=Gemmata sp. SH-PL17 TaxID=1630693 RepID=UPI00078CA351|nr:hypothetical protein [Gemmata sp. SH-PL17]AMV26754.1 hypothetical protein VT84_20305 [Gemmata sp. SH-PL17]
MDAIFKSQAEQLAREMATQATTLDDLNGLMRAMMKTALERMLNTEMDVHLGRRAQPVGTNDNTTHNAEATSGSENVPTTSKRSHRGLRARVRKPLRMRETLWNRGDKLRAVAPKHPEGGFYNSLPNSELQ